MGSGGGDVRDDVWQTAILQPGPREAVRAHPHGGHPLPSHTRPRGTLAALWPSEERPNAKVRSLYRYINISKSQSGTYPIVYGLQFC